MRVLAFAVLALAIRQHLPDPECRSGTSDTTGHACCPSECQGVCDERNPICSSQKTAEKPQCCPSKVEAMNRQCDSTKPPCTLSDKYRMSRTNPLHIYNPNNASTMVHAKHDCQKALKHEQARQSVAQNFVIQDGKNIKGCTAKGGMSDAGAVAQQCMSDETCLGFSTDDSHSPTCSYFATTDQSKIASGQGKVFIKVRDSAGRDFKAGINAVRPANATVVPVQATTTTVAPKR